MIGDFLFWTGILLLLYAFYFYNWLTIKYDYFKIREVPFLKPILFFWNNMGFVMLRGYSMSEYMCMLHRTNPGTKILGTFNFRQPNLIIRDPETIKQILVRDFDHFEDHSNVLDDKVDVLFGNTLFFLTGSKWRDMRATLSPAFTGLKMRNMFELVVECAKQMSESLSKQCKSSGSTDCDMKELFTKYANDVISSTSFGYKINSFEDPNNEFYLSGKKFSEFASAKAIFRIVMILMLPKVASFLNISIIDQKNTNFFRTVILENIDSRDKKGIVRPDMINILMNVKKGNSHLNSTAEEKQKDGFASIDESSIGIKTVKREWSDDEIIAQCFGFFLAGVDTSSTVLSFVVYELFKNADIQQKLYEEVQETQKSLNGKMLTYEVLQNMKYMDMIVCEVLRLWPPAPGLDRVCVKDYNYDDGQCKFKIEKGTTLIIPVRGLHFDEKYWHNPNIFDPERFSDENKGRIVQGSYLPFGFGPRGCIGSRLALMKAKTVIFYLLLNFKFEPNEKSQIPVKLKSGPAGLATEKGIHVTLKLRN